MNVVMAHTSEVRPDERRRAKRYAIRIPVIVRVNGVESAHMTVNASAGGLLIRPEVEDTEPDTDMIVDIGALALNVEAVVVAHRPQGTALRFIEPSAGEQIALAIAEQAQRTG